MFAYLIPTIFPLFNSYGCVIAPPAARLGDRVAHGSGTVLYRVTVHSEGRLDTVAERTVSLVDGQPGDEDAFHALIKAGSIRDGIQGFAEVSWTAADDETRFTTKLPVSFYALYGSSGRTGFRSDGALKYGSPPVIQQVAAFGRFLDGYPVVRLDRDRRYGESLSMINPYPRPIIVDVRTHDGRRLPRINVPAASGRLVPIEPILGQDERRWSGRIQISASNRLIINHVRHRLGDPSEITDVEHLDPFRGEPTHVPASRKLRLDAGKFLKRRYGIG